MNSNELIELLNKKERLEKEKGIKALDLSFRKSVVKSSCSPYEIYTI